MRGLMDDIGQAIRALARRPGFVAALVLPLGLGIGATSAVFSIVDAVLFRPLPVRDVDQLVRVYTVLDANVAELNTSSYPVYREYRDGVQAFQSLAAYSDPDPVNLGMSGSAAERVSCALVTGNYFDVMGRNQ